MGILCENINKKYYKNQENILQNINLQVDTGQFISIIGRSGCGKTTLLNLIALFDKPDSGHISIDGIRTSTLSESKLCAFRSKNISYITQESLLIENRSVYYNLALPLHYRGYEKEIIKSRVHDMLDQLELTGKKDSICAELSGGERQRVNVGRSLIWSPQYLLADEPTGSVDEETERHILHQFANLHAQKGTIIMVTHNLHLTEDCDSIYKISSGKLIK